MNARAILLLAWVLIGLACRDDAQRTDQPDTTRGMMTMRMPSLERLPEIRAYLDTVVRAEPAVLAELAPNHAARMERMLDAMDQDMRAMNMRADSTWQALADSVRVDLRALPGWRGEALVLRMRAHAGQMRRLVQMHERMMTQMEM